jgi:hypothetical protein
LRIVRYSDGVPCHSVNAVETDDIKKLVSDYFIANVITATKSKEGFVLPETDLRATKTKTLATILMMCQSALHADVITKGEISNTLKANGILS